MKTLQVDKLTLSTLLHAFWRSQFKTRNAAENTVCAYDDTDNEACGDRYEDFTAHDPCCRFVSEWGKLRPIREFVGDQRTPVVRGG